MSNISEKVYLQKIESSPEPIKRYVSGIFLNNSYLTFLEKYKNSITNKKEVADTLRNETLLFLIKINSFDVFIENIVEILDIKPLDAEKIVEDFFNICIPNEVQNLIKELNQMQNKNIEEIKFSEPTHISHHDILSEIENPTPSLDTTTDFQNASNIVSPTNISNTTNTANSTQPTTSANPVKPSNTTNPNISPTSTEPSLHSPTPTAPYTNPALQIATKLGQNLSTPSASIPKDIYISKKPDPYHEPVQ